MRGAFQSKLIDSPARYPPAMQLQFQAEVWFWRGPAPWHFVTAPPQLVEPLAAAAQLVTYGWGMVPVAARIGTTAWSTSLWPKDGGYIVPLRTSVRRGEGIDLGDAVTVHLRVEV